MENKEMEFIIIKREEVVQPEFKKRLINIAQDGNYNMIEFFDQDADNFVNNTITVRLRREIPPLNNPAPNYKDRLITLPKRLPANV